MNNTLDNFLFVRVTANKKTGPIPVTINNSETCPDACSLKNNGCYANHGPLLIAWKRVDAGKGNSTNFAGLCEQISTIYKNSLWRYAVAGDLPGNNNTIDHTALNQLVEANRGRRGFTFTHKPVGISGQELVNAQAIFAANKSGFAINLSADNIGQADDLHALGIGPVVVVLPQDHPHKATKTPAGHQIVVCPAVTQEDMTCANCGLCAISNRKSIIGFPAHGVKKKHVSQLVQLRKKAA